MNTGFSGDRGTYALIPESGAMSLYQFGRQRGLTRIAAHRDDAIDAFWQRKKTLGFSTTCSAKVREGERNGIWKRVG